MYTEKVKGKSIAFGVARVRQCLPDFGREKFPISGGHDDQARPANHEMGSQLNGTPSNQSARRDLLLIVAATFVIAYASVHFELSEALYNF